MKMGKRERTALHPVTTSTHRRRNPLSMQRIEHAVNAKPEKIDAEFVRVEREGIRVSHILPAMPRNENASITP